MFGTTLQDPLWYFLYFGPGTDQVFVWIQFGLRTTDSMSTPTLNKEKVRLNKVLKEKLSQSADQNLVYTIKRESF